MPQLDEDTISDAVRRARAADGTLHVGFTGTRALNEDGREAIAKTLLFFRQLTDLHGLTLEVVHGGCVGADAFVGQTALIYGADVHCCLPEDMSRVPATWRLNCHTYQEVPGSYRNRNKAIVRRSQLLFAVADYPEHHGKSGRGCGTWMTIRMGREANIPTFVCIQHEEG